MEKVVTMCAGALEAPWKADHCRFVSLRASAGTARVYLNHLVDGEDEIIIEARANVAIAMMAAPSSRGFGASEAVALADVVVWCAPEDSNL